MTFQLSQQNLKRLLVLILGLNGFFILFTLLSDLGFRIATNPIAGQFDLKNEVNVAVWYSSVLLLLTGVAALAIAFSPPPAGVGARWYRAVWIVAAMFFIGISIDETAQLHEKAGMLFTLLFGRVPGLTDGFGHGVFAWVLALMPLIVVFVAGMTMAARIFFRFQPAVRKLTLAGVACYGGVIVAEVVQSQMMRRGMGRSIQGAIEEGLELAGTTLFLVAFCRFLQTTQRRVEETAAEGRRTLTAQR